MSWMDASSDGIGSQDRTYSVGKYPVRKQWSLNVSTPGLLDIAAYFRSEEHARTFADTFGLTITDYREARR
jgi:hypothetical protein